MEAFDTLNRENVDYIDSLYRQYQSDPQSVDPYWRAFFAGFEAAGGRATALSGVFDASGQPQPHDARAGVELKNLVHSYRELGHFIADLDPLGHNRPTHALLDLGQFGLSPDDLDKRVTHSDFRGPFDGTLRDLVDKLQATYCRTLGVEFTNISDKGQREWLIQRMEPILNRPPLTAAQRKALLYELVAAQGFEDFLAVKHQGQKRFGLEGAESLIALLNTLVDDGASLGIEEVVMGMAHRGRLNVLAHVLNKPYEVILREFEGTPLSDQEGDVKYHLGYSQDRPTKNNHVIHIALSYNPSHLELVDPVVVGIVRAKQNYRGDHATRTRVVPILIHGDAAFCGQGIVHETLGLSELPYYRTGGTIHVIVNNQIGFTTLPRQGRFTPYPTDVAKMIQAPIFHVNGDDPEACVHAANLAIAFRQEFHCDVMIDLWCYRKNGHNEQDEASFTQPVMAREIAAKTSVRDLYAAQLIEQGMISAEEFEAMKTEARRRLDEALTHARELRPPAPTQMALAGAWTGFSRAGQDWSAVTRVSPQVLAQVGQGATRVPPGFTVHPKLAKLLAARLDMATGKAPIDWGGAEMLALGSLVLEKVPVRLVGQDSQRGTFSHRHAALRDFNTGDKYVPLANLSENQAPIIFVNTMLSELAVLGFEYGFSSADPRNLVIWEAQFGDFINMAQPIVDQFIVAAESKWQKMSGLVMLLPHGYEGSGPEHSYAYLDRFLSLCAENNIQVIYPSTPAQYFHVLRRQMLRNFRKPLVLMMPKANLRDAISTLGDLTEGSFSLVIDDPSNPPRERVRRVLLCSGKIYFALEAARKKAGLSDVALVRVEQLYPYPQKELQTILAKYRNAHEVCWVQEETKNRGAWTFMSARLEPMLAETAILTYAGREEAASPAVGSKKINDREEVEIISRALELADRQKADATPANPELAKITTGPGLGGD